MQKIVNTRKMLIKLEWDKHAVYLGLSQLSCAQIVAPILYSYSYLVHFGYIQNIT